MQVTIQKGWSSLQLYVLGFKIRKWSVFEYNWFLSTLIRAIKSIHEGMKRCNVDALFLTKAVYK